MPTKGSMYIELLQANVIIFIVLLVFFICCIKHIKKDQIINYLIFFILKFYLTGFLLYFNIAASGTVHKVSIIKVADFLRLSTAHPLGHYNSFNCTQKAVCPLAISAFIKSKAIRLLFCASSAVSTLSMPA